MRSLLSLLVLLGLGALLILAVAEMPPFGAPDAPAHRGVAVKYLQDAPQDTGAVNVIAAIILDYRAFDTLGEATVLFVAVTAVIAVLSKR